MMMAHDGDSDRGLPFDDRCQHNNASCKEGVDAGDERHRFSLLLGPRGDEMWVPVKGISMIRYNTYRVCRLQMELSNMCNL